MARDAQHSTSDIVTVFARQGIAVSTIARALAIPAERVNGMCRRAHEDGSLQMLPPQTPDDTRHAMLSELTNLRAQLDDAQAELREIRNVARSTIDQFTGVGGLTRREAVIVATIVRSRRATRASIYHALYGDSEESVGPKIVDVFVCKLRKKLKPLGVEILTQWGIGFYMNPASALRIKELAGMAELATIESPRLVPSHREMVA